MLNPGLSGEHLRVWVVEPVLGYLAPEIPWSRDAVALIVETAVQESRLRWLDQLTPGPGPALGLWQMEARTHDDLHENFIANRTALRDKVLRLLALWPSRLEQLRTNLAYGAAMCRVLYRRAPGAIPDTIEGRAAYWKEHYNTRLGRGTVEDYLASCCEAGIVNA